MRSNGLCLLLSWLPLWLGAADAPSDTPYPGTLTLSVDLRDAGRKIFRIHESIPARPGALELLFPEWIPGEHEPSGSLNAVVGVHISTHGQTLAWRRDLDDPYALHLEVPAGTDGIEVEFQFLSSTSGGDFTQGVSATPRLVNLEWHQALIYPAGYRSRQIQVRAEVTLPSHWQYASALPLESADASVRFKPVSLDELMDSPLIAGENFKRIDLAPSADAPVHLNVVADEPQDLPLQPEQTQHLQALVVQAGALFASHHYQHYDFLLTLSDITDHFGLEHLQSSDDRTDADYFTDPDTSLASGELLAHEYVHSWNGKFRRPAGLIIPNFNTPMHDDLLWVYEGLTNYYGEVLAARAGVWTPTQYRERLAGLAALMSEQSGRRWRPLQDTADAATRLFVAPPEWRNWRRGTDFYEEGSLLWLEVDTRIRDLSRGRRSLDDFMRAFFGADPRAAPVGYEFADLVAALNRVQPYDWAALLRARLDYTGTEAPLEGLRQSGWRLSYSAEPNAWVKARDKTQKRIDLRPSLGLLIDNDKDSGSLIDVLWDGPAFAAGLGPGMKLIAVDGDQYSPEQLEQALRTHADDQLPLELLVESDHIYRSVRVEYHGGAHYPHLERSGGEDLLSEIVRPRSER